MKRSVSKISALFIVIFLFSFTSVFSQIKVGKTIKKPVNTVIINKKIIKKIPKIGFKKGTINLTEPYNGDQNVPINLTFKWEAVPNVTSYELKYTIIQAVGDPVVPFTIISGIENTSYQLSLENGRVYYWGINTIDTNGVRYESNLQGFTTQNSPPAQVYSPFPENNETDVPSNVILSWSPVSDPDGDSVYYNVLFSDNVSFVEQEQGYAQGVIVSYLQSQTTFQTSLEPGTTYFWRIESRDNKNGRTRGPIWNFKTSPITWITPITTDTFIDNRDQKSYKTITIGSQTWMAENLAYLPEVNNLQDSYGIAPFYSVINYAGLDVNEAKNTSMYQTYGVLYNAVASRTACPNGWHLPSDAEWDQLELYLGLPMSEIDALYERGRVVAGLLRETGTQHWRNTNNDVNNASQFNAVPAGFTYLSHVNHNGLGDFTSWWTSTQNSNKQVIRTLSIHPTYFDMNLNKGSLENVYSLCVRCVRD
ncbi:MAG: FISUMP domain-containing protein [Lutibacter sp.]|uniref:FISUMP domain-containing protein n=1 Tax=Lutibacter sp. TaxID=1925666 RepID=UPI003859535B